MPKKKTIADSWDQGLNTFIGITIIVILLAIAVSLTTHNSLAIKTQSKGNSDIIRQNCLIGLEKAAREAQVCTTEEADNFDYVIYLRETQGMAVAKNYCKTVIETPGCKGLCNAAINCYDVPPIE